jgi:signal transduction histidine kinase
MARQALERAVPQNDRSSSWSARPKLKLVFFGITLVSFLVAELMHTLLVPDLGRHWERLLAEGLSAVLVALLASKLVYAAEERRETTLVRMQVISEMNHHIRNALAAISLTAESTDNQQCIRVIEEGVDRIEWALREILLRTKPLPEEELERLRYFQPQRLSLRRPGDCK